MASIRKKSNSRYWFACFSLPGGKRVQRSTKTGDRREAMRLAHDFERVACQQITNSQARRVIQDVFERVTGQNLQSIAVAEFLDGWLRRKKAEVANSSLIAYEAVVADFKKFLGSRATMELSDLRTSDMVDFRDDMVSRVTATTVNKKLKILRSAFKAAWQDELITDNPADRVPTIRIKTKQFERRGFSLEELKRLWLAAHGEWRGMIMFGLYTGQRLGDIAVLTWQNLDLELNELRLSTEKTGRRQIIPLARPLRDFIATLEGSDDPKAHLFQGCATVIISHGRSSTLSAQFHEIMVSASLAESRANKQKHKSGRSVRRENNELSFHSLRHSATSLMKNAGVSPAIVQEFIGHDSKAVSQNYTHIETESLRKAAEMMPDISGDS